MGRFSKLIHWLVSPFFVGLVITSIVLWFSADYYANWAEESNLSPPSLPLKLLQIADQQSYDLLLQSRGPIPPHPDIALLTVDELSLKKLGRWPWPREVIAEAIENAMDYDVRVMAFDMVFAEPSAQKELELIRRIEPRAQFSKSQIRELKIAADQLDSDRIFAETIAKYRDRLVMGSVWPESNRDWHESIPPHSSICIDWAFRMTSIFKSIDENEDSFIGVVEPFLVNVPYALEAIYNTHLAQIRSEILDIIDPELSAAEQDQLVLAHQYGYCTRWLEPDQDELYTAATKLWPDVQKEDDDYKDDSFESWVDTVRNESYRYSLVESLDWITNIPLIANKTSHTGFFSASLDSDGTIRRYPLVLRSGKFFLPSIGFKAFLVAKGLNAGFEMYENPYDTSEVRVKDFQVTEAEEGKSLFQIPSNWKGQIHLNYTGKQRMFPYIRFAELLNSSHQMAVEQRVISTSGEPVLQTSVVNKADFLKGKILVVGATASGIYDLRVTPFEKDAPGAETHLTAIDNLMRQDFIYRHDHEQRWMQGFLFVIGLLLSALLSWLSAVPGLIFATFAMTSLLAINKYYFFANGWFVSIVIPLSLVGGLYVGITFFKFLTEERKKKQIRSTFSKYVSPAIVSEILEDPSNLELGGRKEDITVFFSDVRGFTTISEKLDPKTLGDFLNSYLTPMTDIVFDNKGTLDKYMGDAIMAFFGAPVHYADHPQAACQCALESIERLKLLQAGYAAQKLPAIDIGIGLNTGECSVGNMGSETVRNYTVMGDAVNLASRLEAINKQYGTRIILSENTFQRVKDDFICREVDWVKVKGKLEPVKIYELISEKSVAKPEDSEQNAKIIPLFNDAYQYYHSRNFKKSLEILSEALKLSPNDGPTQLYTKRCQKFIEEPPPEDWDGVYVMKTK